MAVILYKGANRTVDTIADRNAIPYKIDSMVVTVLDAIADPNAGSGIATYRWVEQEEKWILISTAGIDALNFETEELEIVDGGVSPSNIAIDGAFWGIYVVNGDVIMAEPRLSELNVSPNRIGGLEDYNGYSLRFTYAYGTVSQQVTDYVDFKATEIATSLDGQSGTVEQFEAEL